MTPFDPSELDLSIIFSRLSFGSFESPSASFPGKWKPWKKPVPQLPIDRFVTELTERRRPPNLRRPDELLRHHVLGACPYAVARAEVARAVLNASVCYDTDQRRDKAIAAMKDASDLLKASRTSLVTILDLLMRVDENAKEFGFVSDVDGLSLAEKADDIARLLELGDPLYHAYVRLSRQAAAKVWRIAFAGALFRSWWILTGRDPSTSDLFLNFLDAAWESLSSDAGEQNWESAIRTARTRAREEHGCDAPWRERYCNLDPSLVHREALS
ncbi:MULTISPECIES: hypothetical protein [unclassified Bradyrhizobium]|uniref:hypothetical protein n=1 Tax=unclassified Bradyrhizobium TaxID=2631580 RepID=UPI0028E2245D|nr:MULTISPECIES: hypothetical protein [unclassified Bradyrhizobium]